MPKDLTPMMRMRLVRADKGVQQFVLRMTVPTVDVIEDRNEVIRQATEAFATMLRQQLWRMPPEGPLAEPAP